MKFAFAHNNINVLNLDASLTFYETAWLLVRSYSKEIITSNHHVCLSQSTQNNTDTPDCFFGHIPSYRNLHVRDKS